MAMDKCRECGTEVSDEAKKCPKCGIAKPVNKTSTSTKVIAGLFGFGILWSIVSNNSQNPTSHKENSTPVAPKVNPKNEALRLVTLDKWEWRKGGFDSVMLLDAKIKNTGARDIKDIEIECTHSSNSGTRIDRNKKVVYELVRAGKSVNIKEFSMGFVHSQATSTSCKITDLVLL